MLKAQKDQRHTYINQRAMELARSGVHSDWLSIEVAIRGEGYPEARHQLDSKWLREELDRECGLARGKAS